MNKNGFTLVEILVIIAIMAVLSGIAIVYSHIGQDQITLSIEESKVAQFVLEAKELSIATYSSNGATCAYGVEFNYASSTYSLFAYNSAATSSVGGGRPICPSIASTSEAIVPSAINVYAAGSWQVKVTPGVVLHDYGAASDTVQDILFYPPNPCTLIRTDSSTFQSNCVPRSTGYGSPPSEAYIYLSTANGSDSRTITINPAGQVSL
jgi:prepilin-type N-terminal cleavage/methylation domain-containing protein